jgi:hypothetical protein
MARNRNLIKRARETAQQGVPNADRLVGAILAVLEGQPAQDALNSMCKALAIGTLELQSTDGLADEIVQTYRRLLQETRIARDVHDAAHAPETIHEAAARLQAKIDARGAALINLSADEQQVVFQRMMSEVTDEMAAERADALMAKHDQGDQT